MATRTVSMFIAVLLAISIAPGLVLASDDDTEIDEAVEKTSELISYTQVLFDCNMLIETIQPWPIQEPQDGFFFVTLEAEGKECEQAFDVMNNRGRNRGLFFRPAKDNATDDERPAGTNFDLIHEIDPEVEEQQ
ncbi:MAG: hypothetical protein QNI99_10560 [Woeseiaceae bacterium]|nr:hypothetical protein [Woeseiaceae bacterium]